jgi:hypothetical protein
MNELGITSEERECLRGWFRQAIAELELREVAAQFIKDRCLQPTGERHRSAIKRRNARSRIAHVRELV